MQEIAISVFNVFIFHFSFFVAIPVVLQFLGGLRSSSSSSRLLPIFSGAIISS